MLQTANQTKPNHKLVWFVQIKSEAGLVWLADQKSKKILGLAWFVQTKPNQTTNRSGLLPTLRRFNDC